ncbi:ImmA/IrrE family metallo-endopeptidase [Clostridium lacusfryxellense]|uniref:ImmA/IrrE family metallo-endopeptidase n=1 Tax=Clostridium lacusfryxellense TaxID=205328 RepID=UPI001C0BAE08|nr:ImmA/IrrE family metallo-endopeptidase [Clostridium lacusfryxellense]MBU3111002.1 ImmA/IrrE family metallo-endopeptidase [Clostridium lacusfryxellense]
MDYVRDIAQHMMKKYKTNDPFELAEYLNIKIMYEDLGKHINGFYQSCPKVKIIHINNKLGSEARRIVCAHELGHAVLHSKVNIIFVQKHTFCDKGKFERQAIIFAAELLIPNGLLLEHPDYSIDQIAALHNISLELLKHKYNI